MFILLIKQSDIFPKLIKEPLLAQTVKVKLNGSFNDNKNVFGYKR